ncbi:hypothetical protein AAVH_30546 [Aphelenchoides avenae]|nr:hypothetical protein AAVH_30546 [Aphelenchus avenae]
MGNPDNLIDFDSDDISFNGFDDYRRKRDHVDDEEAATTSEGLLYLGDVDRREKSDATGYARLDENGNDGEDGDGRAEDPIQGSTDELHDLGLMTMKSLHAVPKMTVQSKLAKSAKRTTNYGILSQNMTFWKWGLSLSKPSWDIMMVEVEKSETLSILRLLQPAEQRIAPIAGGDEAEQALLSNIKLGVYH